jgi:cytochrome c oxidase subunit 2
MSKQRVLIAAAAMLMLGLRAEAATDLSFCTVCHGANGNGNPAIRAPKIAGMEPWYVKRQLEAFKAGLRGTNPNDAAGTEMQPMAASLHEDAMLDQVVAYVATFKPKSPPITVTGDIARGKQFYETCAACHGTRGEGNREQNAPALAQRTDWYLVTQLQNYMNGLRGAQSQDVLGAQMRAVSTSLPDAQAAIDVVAYINTMR